jgi:hypothetical protein
MKLLSAFALSLLSLSAAAADSGSCYGVNDADARSYCLAKAHQDPSACYTIQNSATRSMCLAEVRK